MAIIIPIIMFLGFAGFLSVIYGFFKDVLRDLVQIAKNIYEDYIKPKMEGDK